jgi:hypothetical protein
MMTARRPPPPGDARDETPPTSRLIDAGRSDEHALIAGNQPLRIVRRIPASDADGERLGHVFSDGEKLWHRLEGLPAIILIQSRHDHSLAAIGQLVAHVHEIQVEELPFVNADDLRILMHALKDLARGVDDFGLQPPLAVGDDLILAVARIHARLEDLHLLPRDLRSTQAADQFFALAAEHPPADHFDPSHIASDNMHSSHPLHLLLGDAPDPSRSRRSSGRS